MAAIQPLGLDSHKNIFILTGAGISVASGLSTYRGPGGLWEKADVARIADARNLPETLPDLWRLYGMRRRQALAALPNAAHQVIADLQQEWGNSDRGKITLVTQNVDGLHLRAGSIEVAELHGSAFRTRCINRTCSLIPFHDENIYDSVPVCSRCGDALRPDVVLFGENIPRAVLGAVITDLAECDLFLSIGTSGAVWPAAEFVRGAAAIGARTISVNVEAMDPPHPSFAEEYVGPAEEVLPVLLSR